MAKSAAPLQVDSRARLALAPVAKHVWLERWTDVFNRYPSVLSLGFLIGLGSWFKFLDPTSPLIVLAGVGVGLLSRSMGQGGKNIFVSIGGFVLSLLAVALINMIPGFLNHHEGGLSLLSSMSKVMLLMAVVCHCSWILGVPFGYFLRVLLSRKT